MKIVVCTSFSPEGYTYYGRRFLESMMAFTDINIVAYHEGQESERPSIRVSWRDLSDDYEHDKFVAEHGKDPNKVGSPRDPNSQSIRFCHKVFAITDAAKKTDADWLVWMDADVLVTSNPVWSECLPDHASLSYLGRPHYAYTECGFVGYRLTDSVLALLADMRRYYTSGEMFTRPKSDWHDSRCFDICRERSAVPRDRWCSLSAHVTDTTHVWPHTVLAKWSTHQKGPRRKVNIYGGVVP